MKIHGQYDNTHKLKSGPLNDNKGVEHLWNISHAVTQAKQLCQIPERDIWYGREEYRGAYAVQSPTLVDRDPRKVSRHLSIYQMTLIPKNIATIGKSWFIVAHLQRQFGDYF